jgi:octaprenyl-diphosphate synthase
MRGPRTKSNDLHASVTIPLLQPILRDDMQAVDRVLREALHSDVPLIRRVAEYIIAGGGKRLRPALLLLTAQACGYRGTHHHTLAAVVEMIHTATLLHDDVVDDSDLRRGLATANAVWGNKASVLVGDFLFSRAFELMVEDGALPVLAILSRASAIIAEGEVLQLVTSNDVATTEDAYLEVINAKTAQLFAAASRIGAVVSDRSEAEAAALETFGRNLGIAFQLIDDMLDYSAKQSELGKSVGDDFRDGKITLPVVLAVRAADEREREFWRRTLEDSEQHDGDFEHAIELMRRHGTLTATLDRAREYGDAARRALMSFRDSPERQALDEVIEFCLERGY